MTREPCPICHARKACAHYPDYAHSFSQRVALAARCIASGDGVGSRAFDNCFEMYDGDFVVLALERMARNDTQLASGIDRLWNSANSRELWAKTCARLAHLPTASIARAAAQHRRMHGQACNSSHMPDQLALAL